MKNIEDQDAALPYFVPKPISADEAAEVLFPTSPLPERPDIDNDEPLLPPLMDE